MPKDSFSCLMLLCVLFRDGEGEILTGTVMDLIGKEHFNSTKHNLVLGNVFDRAFKQECELPAMAWPCEGTPSIWNKRETAFHLPKLLYLALISHSNRKQLPYHLPKFSSEHSGRKTKFIFAAHTSELQNTNNLQLDGSQPEILVCHFFFIGKLGFDK